MPSYSTIVDTVDNKPPEPRLLSAWLRLDPNETGDAYAAQVKAEVLRVAEMVMCHEERLPLAISMSRAGHNSAFFDIASSIGIAITFAVAESHPDRASDARFDLFADDIALSALWCAARGGESYAYVALLAYIGRLDDDWYSDRSRGDVMQSLASRLPISFDLEQASLAFGFVAKASSKDSDCGRMIKRADEDRAPDTGRDCDVGGFRQFRNVIVNRRDKRDKPMPPEYRSLRGPLRLYTAPSATDIATSLLAEFPWAEDLIGRLRADLVLGERLGRRHFQLRPTIITGAPGSGKSRIVSRLIDLTGVPGTVLSASGSSDNRALAGTAKGWSSATPSLPVTTMAARDCANPIIVVEEVDKAGGSDANGFLVKTLLMMTEPSTARTYLDECLGLAVDLSAVSWVMTCNRQDLVDPLLRTRCRILEMPSPRPQDFDVLLYGVRWDVANEHGVSPNVLPVIEPPVIDAMRAGYVRGRLSARQLAALVRRALELSAEAEQVPVRH